MESYHWTAREFPGLSSFFFFDWTEFLLAESSAILKGINHYGNPVAFSQAKH